MDKLFLRLEKATALSALKLFGHLVSSKYTTPIISICELVDQWGTGKLPNL